MVDKKKSEGLIRLSLNNSPKRLRAARPDLDAEQRELTDTGIRASAAGFLSLKAKFKATMENNRVAPVADEDSNGCSMNLS